MSTVDTEKKRVLGRGLASLIPEAGLLGGAAAKKEFFNCDIEKVVPNTYQPRKIFDKEALDELVASIKVHGIIQPLVVRRNQGQYELIAGERRWRAAQKAGLKQVPVVVREVSEDRASLEMALIENIQREELNCIEEALAYQQLVDEFSLSQEDVADAVGKNRATVANTLRLLKLPMAIREDILSNKLSMGHARALLSLDSAENQIKARDEILSKKLSVRDAEKLVSQMTKGGAATLSKDAAAVDAKFTQKDANMVALEEKLRRHYGTKVIISGSMTSGKIEFEYSTKDELTRISDALLWNS